MKVFKMISSVFILQNLHMKQFH